MDFLLAGAFFCFIVQFHLEWKKYCKEKKKEKNVVDNPQLKLQKKKKSYLVIKTEKIAPTRKQNVQGNDTW